MAHIDFHLDALGHDIEGTLDVDYEPGNGCSWQIDAISFGHGKHAKHYSWAQLCKLDETNNEVIAAQHLARMIQDDEQIREKIEEAAPTKADRAASRADQEYGYA